MLYFKRFKKEISFRKGSKNMKKRIVSIILVAVFIISACAVFAACGKKADTKATTAPTTAATTVATAAPATAAPATANTGSNSNSNSGNSTQQSTNAAAADSAAEGEANTGASTASYSGNTVTTMQQAMDSVVNQIGLEEGQYAEYDGTIIIPDGSVWHNVLILDKEGELVHSYYISDTTGEIKTVNEMNAYAYRDQ